MKPKYLVHMLLVFILTPNIAGPLENDNSLFPFPNTSPISIGNLKEVSFGDASLGMVVDIEIVKNVSGAKLTHNKLTKRTSRFPAFRPFRAFNGQCQKDSGIESIGITDEYLEILYSTYPFNSYSVTKDDSKYFFILDELNRIVFLSSEIRAADNQLEAIKSSIIEKYGKPLRVIEKGRDGTHLYLYAGKQGSMGIDTNDIAKAFRNNKNDTARLILSVDGNPASTTLKFKAFRHDVLRDMAKQALSKCKSNVRLYIDKHTKNAEKISF